jgi:hypothetical protein
VAIPERCAFGQRAQTHRSRPVRACSPADFAAPHLEYTPLLRSSQSGTSPPNSYCINKFTNKQTNKSDSYVYLYTSKISIKQILQEILTGCLHFKSSRLVHAQRCKRAELGRAWIVRARLVYFGGRLELGLIGLEPCKATKADTKIFHYLKPNDIYEDIIANKM